METTSLTDFQVWASSAFFQYKIFTNSMKQNKI
jgi:hypothetical protein